MTDAEKIEYLLRVVVELAIPLEAIYAVEQGYPVLHESVRQCVKEAIITARNTVNHPELREYGKSDSN